MNMVSLSSIIMLQLVFNSNVLCLNNTVGRLKDLTQTPRNPGRSITSESSREPDLDHKVNESGADQEETQTETFLM